MVPHHEIESSIIEFGEEWHFHRQLLADVSAQSAGRTRNVNTWGLALVAGTTDTASLRRSLLPALI